jgi:hypothetical protein
VAIIVGIGPWTNFMLLEYAYPDILKQANLFLMGGFMYEIPASSGILTRLVTQIDGNAFNDSWCDILCR